MKLLTLSLSLLFFLTSCAFGPGKARFEAAQESEAQGNPRVYDVEQAQEVLKPSDKPLSILKILSQSSTTKNNPVTQKEIDRNNLAVMKGTEVLHGECFKKFFLSRKLIQTGNRTNQQVLDHLYSPEIKLNLVMYRTDNGTHGYTYSNTDKIWLNRKWHDDYGACTVASNLHHEGSHKKGYAHAKYGSKSRPFSVPYSINAGFALCCKD